LDTEEDELDFVGNSEDQTLFHIIEYDNEKKYKEDDLRPYFNCIVKIIIKNKDKCKEFVVNVSKFIMELKVYLKMKFSELKDDVEESQNKDNNLDNKMDNIKDNNLFVESYESHSSRNVPLNNSAKLALQKYLDEGRYPGRSKNVFVTKTGKTLLARNIRSLLNRFFIKADLREIKVNDLRNTFIVFQLKSGVPIDVVSQVVGHKRISTTEKYLELIDNKEEARGIKLKEL
jgi:hypothetical protein